MSCSKAETGVKGDHAVVGAGHVGIIRDTDIGWGYGTNGGGRDRDRDEICGQVLEQT